MIGFTLGLFLRARKALGTSSGGGAGSTPTYYIYGF